MVEACFINWTQAFENLRWIDGGAEIPAKLLEDATRFRQANAARIQTGLRYGDEPGQILDLITPEGPPKGLAVFIHGGYWLAFGPSDWSHLSAGALGAGWAVAMLGYPLAPKRRISEITRDVAKGLGFAAAKIAGPIRLAGHSAGGHLVTRLASDPSLTPPDVYARIAGVVSISGVHDLRPLLLTDMNSDLQLTEDEARAESPALSPPPICPATAWVGGNERPEFLRQSALLAEAWRRAGGNMRLHVEPGRHHMDILALLTEVGSDLCRCWLGEAPDAALASAGPDTAEF